uniref:DNA polymerase theta-like helix-turn-helix domain-containing protein n=1 Tax=Xiphophorus couchianus TaxID=32473 RepID=A0A3B5MF01_9TELE
FIPNRLQACTPAGTSQSGMQHIRQEPFCGSTIIVGGVASSPQDVRLYASCSLLAASMKSDNKTESNEQTSKGAIEACVEWLMGNEFISIQQDGQDLSQNV